jgi:hypothetical protein
LGEQARGSAHEAGVEKVIAARGLRETLSRNGYFFGQNRFRDTLGKRGYLRRPGCGHVAAPGDRTDSTDRTNREENSVT